MRLFGSSAKRVEETPIVLTAAPPRHDADAYIGQTFLGKYRVRKYLGEGSNAQVFLAQSTTDPNSRVVVKRIKDEATIAPRFRQFFEAEVQSMLGFQHPYVVRLLDASLDDPLGSCLVLEYIPGITLEAVLQRDRILHHDRVGLLLGPLAHALYAAQLGGIVHRDLKPANLMVLSHGTDKESVRVMDFGFAGFSAKPHIQLAELTGQGPIFACGTPAYVSPEMIRGDSTDARADIYSVGVMLYELLTGRLPFDYEDQQKLLTAHVRDAPPRFNRVGAGHIPPVVEAAVQIALSKYPSERHQNMKELCDQFSRGVGWDCWDASKPADYTPPEPTQIQVSAMSSTPVDDIDDRFILSDTLEACLPEKLAAIKLRGFIEEVQGQVVENEPGLIRVRLELPPGWKDPAGRSGVFSFLSGSWRSIGRGREPIEVSLKMNKIDANRVAVIVDFRPMKMYMPSDPGLWLERCEAYYSVLRKYIMPEV